MRFRSHRRWGNPAMGLLLAISMLSFMQSPISLNQAEAQEGSRLFAETGKTVKGRFLDYWDDNGGLPRQGYPISEEIREVLDTDGKTYTVQYFERAVFELHPDNANPHDVLLSLLGVSLYVQKYPGGAANQVPSPEPNALAFAQTGKRVGGRFLEYWRANGGLAQFGYPLSDEFDERSDLDGKTYRVQYFERAVFEHHTENVEPYRVLLSQLGTFRYRAKYATHVTAGRVVAGADMTVERSCHTATLLQSGKVLVAGGMVREGDFSANAELYDPVTGNFAPTGPLNRGRACHTASLLHDGRVLIIAGDWHHNLDSAEIYDPTTGKFTYTDSLNHKRSGSPAILLKDGRVLVVGGYDRGLLKSVELYDPGTRKFTLTGEMSGARSTPGASLLPDGRVLITGGGANGNVLSTAEIYDPTTGTFSATGDMSLSRHKHGQVLLPDGRVLVLGGADGRDWRGLRSEAEIYNPATGRFTPTGSMRNKRFKLADAVAVTGQGTLLVAGGGSSVEIYDPAGGEFRSAEGNTGTARYYQTTTALPDGSVLIAGGYDSDIASTDHTWLYKP
ncbi:MAG: kelch repeat-containing protein [Chloroflexia bacterium]